MLRPGHGKPSGRPPAMRTPVTDWIYAHPGALSKIARELKIRPAMVSRVAHGRASSARVTAKLRDLGCPPQTPQTTQTVKGA